MLCTAEKVSVFGEKPFCLVSRATRPDLAFPSRAAKQGRGIELVPGGNQDPQFRLRNYYGLRCSAKRVYTG